MNLIAVKNFKKRMGGVLITALLLSVGVLNSIDIYAQNFTSCDPMGTLAYSLPKTTLSFEVTAVREQFYAGPYAKYASKYLGIDARQSDKTTYEITEIKMSPCVEADQSRRFVVTPGDGTKTFLQLSAQGLISISDGMTGEISYWRFPSRSKGDFSGKGISSNLTSEEATLYKNVKTADSYNKVAIRQDMVVSKSAEQRAKEAAEMIFNLRKKRVQIVTGDTDATFSGEAMGSVINEITKLEQEYMTLFTGYSDFKTETKKFDVVPDAKNAKQVYVAFRLSDREGLVSADNMTGKPYLLELKPEKVSDPTGDVKPSKSTNIAVYRIPAVCEVKLSDGMRSLLKDRIPVYQLGRESTFVLSGK